jgi:hypothetical protein
LFSPRVVERGAKELKRLPEDSNHLDSDFKRFLSGNGLDASRNAEAARRLGVEARHYYAEPNQLYSLKEIAGREKLDFVSCLDCLLETKFYPVLMREWFYALKKGGRIAVRFREDDVLRLGQLKMDVALFFRHDLKLVYRSKTADNEYSYVWEKIRANPDKDEDVGKWSFGIVTTGTRNEWVERIIQSIARQKIPEFEIIVAGNYFERPEPFVKYVPVEDHLPRLTKRKNEVCRHAKHENVVVLHDRVLLEDGWFEGMKKFGNCWDWLGCVVEHNGHRSYDWFSTGYPQYVSEFDRNRGALLYDDWDRWCVTNAGIFVIKKRVWEETQWNELDHYPGNDDMIFSTDLTNRGFFPRFNPYSRCAALSFHSVDAMYHAPNKLKLGKLTGPLAERLYQKANYAAADLFVKSKAFKRIQKSGAYRKIAETARKTRTRVLGRKVDDKSWSKTHKVTSV